MTSKADAVLKKLRKLESNMNCANCNTRAQPGIGFGNVCVKYKTFVCDLCKTSHQAISHRVKSISMSEWTMNEVEELMDENCGGNEACRHIWLQNAPDFGQRYSGGIRPKPGDKVEIFKQFVIDCYEYGKFKATTPYAPHGSGSLSPIKTSTSSKSCTSSPRAATSSVPAIAKPVAVTNLLDEDFFASSSSGPAISSNGPDKSGFSFINENPPLRVQSVPDFLDFSNQQLPHFHSAPVTPKDPFGDSVGSSNFFSSGSTSTSTSSLAASTFDPFGASNSTMSNTSNNNIAGYNSSSFDPFSTTTSSVQGSSLGGMVGSSTSSSSTSSFDPFNSFTNATPSSRTMATGSVLSNSNSGNNFAMMATATPQWNSDPFAAMNNNNLTGNGFHNSNMGLVNGMYLNNNGTINGNNSGSNSPRTPGSNAAAMGYGINSAMGGSGLSNSSNSTTTPKGFATSGVNIDLSNLSSNISSNSVAAGNRGYPGSNGGNSMGGGYSSSFMMNNGTSRGYGSSASYSYSTSSGNASSSASSSASVFDFVDLELKSSLSATRR